MNEAQKSKRNFRNSKTWKDFKKKMKAECNGIDKITNHKLRKGWQLHHQCLEEKEYQNLKRGFLCCNNLTHKVIHWLWTYYQKDPAIIDRLRKEMEIMRLENPL